MQLPAEVIYVTSGHVLYLWKEWTVQVLVLVSFSLQVFLLVFAGTRQYSSSIMSRTLLWLAYLLADSTAVYTLGHMSISSQSPEHRQLVAFWAPFLLVHLGGQDTMTAYAIEDNQLWLRHLLTLVMQALGAAYVLYKYVGAATRTIVAAAVLIYAVGVIKYAERAWALKSSSPSSISSFLDSVTKLGMPMAERPVAQAGDELDAEFLLQGAQDLVHISLGQLVDYKVRPSRLQCRLIGLLHDKGSLCGVVEMQLSLLHDMLYTKAMVAHSWHGWCIRAFSFLATATALLLFRCSRKGGYNDVDVVVTYVLLWGAFLLEAASVLHVMLSPWTCASLRHRRWDRLRRIVLCLRRCSIFSARSRRWPGFIGQHNLVALSTSYKRGLGWRLALLTGAQDLWIQLRIKGSFFISAEIKEFVLEEIHRMVEASQGIEETLWSYRGQRSLGQLEGFLDILSASTLLDFDESIVAWHFATLLYLHDHDTGSGTTNSALVQATKALSNYMLFLLVDRPYMLPSPARPRLYVAASQKWAALDGGNDIDKTIAWIQTGDKFHQLPPELLPGATLANMLLTKVKHKSSTSQVLHTIFALWVEMLCYAASHCSRDSHARQLSNGGDFTTIVWHYTAHLLWISR